MVQLYIYSKQIVLPFVKSKHAEQSVKMTCKVSQCLKATDAQTCCIKAMRAML